MKPDIDQPNRERVPVLSLQVDLCDYGFAIAEIDRLARTGSGGYVCVANVHVSVEAEDDLRFRELVNSADLVLPDGTPLVWMQRWQGKKNAAQVRGPSLMPMLMKHAEAERLKVGFFGGRPEVLEKIIDRASREFPRLDVAYKCSPPFRDLTEDEAEDIKRQISEAGVHILFVGLGCPKQERWMAASSPSVDALMIGVGAAFDLYAGDIREAPPWVRRFGLEWMFRLIQEPRRLFSRYMTVNPRFAWLAAKQLLSGRRQE